MFNFGWVTVWEAVADPGFSPGGASTPKIAIIFQIFAKNCMKMKEFGPPGGTRPWRPPLDLPMGGYDKLHIYLEGPYQADRSLLVKGLLAHGNTRTPV